jgi:hypothetical protein
LVGRSDHHGHHGRSQSHGNHAAGQSGAHDIPRPYNTLPAPILNAMTVLRAEIHASLTLYTLDKIRQSLRLGPAGGVDLREDTLGVVVQQVSCVCVSCVRLCVVRCVRTAEQCFGAG